MIRISVGKPEHTDAVIKALAEIWSIECRWRCWE